MNKVTAHSSDQGFDQGFAYRSSQEINIIYSKFSFVYVVYIDIY